MQKERERDISEQIALGLPAKTQYSGEAQFDQRLFNSSGGMDQGFGEEDSYTVYDKPWREARSMAQHIYRPSKNIEADFDKPSDRSGPIQFERQEEDLFGLDQFLTQAKRAPTSNQHPPREVEMKNLVKRRNVKEKSES